MQSIVSYPERGNYGQSSYRGNTTGKIIKDLIDFFEPKHVFDPMCGSDTTGDVVREYQGIDYTGLDLNPKYGGFDALDDEIQKSSDFIFWHPPYHNIIKYSGNMWGKKDDRDLSRCRTYGEFITKLNKIQAKLIRSLKTGGHIAILVGDVKKSGVLYSIQKDMDWYGSPVNVVIKAQHNFQSASKNYGGNFIPIVHEYLLIFKRDNCYILPAAVVKNINLDLRNSLKMTWRDVVQSALEKLGGKAKLKDLYNEIKNHKKTESNQNWQAKIRQVVQEYEDFESIDRGIYKLAA